MISQTKSYCFIFVRKEPMEKKYIAENSDNRSRKEQKSLIF